jgi:rSAM/selenodomain-associated transferase 1
MTRRHLVLFVRAPQLGSGKRRLAREIGDAATVRFERLMIALLLRRLAADRRWRLRIAVTPDKARHHARHWRRGIEAAGQGGGDLGVRMRRALAACPPGPVVLVGGDIPALGARHVAAAFGLLGRHDLVFGPAEDGGFWLVGSRHPRQLPPLLEQVRWSGPYALADTLAGLPQRIRVGLAERLADVDDGEAFRRLAPHRGF